MQNPSPTNSVLKERRSMASPSPASQNRIQKAVYFIANDPN